MQKAWWIGVFLSVLTGAIVACNKGAHLTVVCRVSELKNVQTSQITEYTYDTQGRISVLSSGNQVYTYEYPDNQTIINYYSAGVFVSKTTAIKNSLGLAVDIRIENTQTGVAWYNYVNEYDGEQLIRTTMNASDNRPVQVTTYQWEDGNIMLSVENGDTTLYSYDLSKPSQTGDYFHLAQLGNGYEQFRVKNIITNAGGYHFGYTFGTDGKISQLEEMFGGQVLADLQLQYDCQNQ